MPPENLSSAPTDGHPSVCLLRAAYGKHASLRASSHSSCGRSCVPISWLSDPGIGFLFSLFSTSSPAKAREGRSESDRTVVRIPRDRHPACHIQRGHRDYHHTILSHDSLPVSTQPIDARHQSPLNTGLVTSVTAQTLGQ